MLHRPASLAQAGKSCDKETKYSHQMEAQMIRWKISAAAAGALWALAMLSLSAQAKPLGTVDWMPFFGLPYPYGFTYTPPNMECYSMREVQTPDGPRIEAVWVCGPPGER
jgi:hypothetical protein